MLGRLLIAEDNRPLRGVLLDCFSALGWIVDVARDGKEAVERFRAERPDVVLLDLWLPVVESIEVLDAMRRIDADVPVVVTSGEPDDELMKTITERGAFACLAKPSRLAEMEQAVIAALRKRRAFAESRRPA